MSCCVQCCTKKHSLSYLSQLLFVRGIGNELGRIAFFVAQPIACQIWALRRHRPDPSLHSVHLSRPCTWLYSWHICPLQPQFTQSHCSVTENVISNQRFFPISISRSRFSFYRPLIASLSPMVKRFVISHIEPMFRLPVSFIYVFPAQTQWPNRKFLLLHRCIFSISGHVLCYDCCSRSIALPQLGYTKAVRVCNDCFEVAYLVAYCLSDDLGPSTDRKSVV